MTVQVTVPFVSNKRVCIIVRLRESPIFRTIDKRVKRETINENSSKERSHDTRDRGISVLLIKHA